MWCVRIGDQLMAATRIEELKQYLPNPASRFGVWLESKYVDAVGINSYTWTTLRGFVDLETGQFTKSTKKDYTGINKFQAASDELPEIESEVIKKILEHMLTTWQKKFAREQRT